MTRDKNILVRTVWLILAVFITLITMSCKDVTKVTCVTLNPSELTMQVGETQQVELIIEPLSSVIYNAKYWSSSDKSVATVDESGNVTAVYAGTCTITANVGGIKATCKITVEAPQYDLTLHKATVYMTGLDSETGAMTQVLRIYDNGLSMDSSGTVTGNGLMLSLALCSPSGTETLSAGQYTISETHNEYTIKPGEAYQEDGKYYVRGSFLGQYSDAGLTVLLLTGGEAQILLNGETYSINAALTGDLGESVNATWSGTVEKYRSDTTIMPETFDYTAIAINDTVITGETSTKQTSVLLSDGKRSLKFVFRIPLSASGQLLAGHYSLSQIDQAFTINGEESWFNNGSEDIDIQSASITISGTGSQWVISGSFITEDGQSHTITNGEKKANNLRKERPRIEKFFVNLQP